MRLLKLKMIMGAAALTALASGQMAVALETANQCLTKPQSEALIVNLMPSLLTGLQGKCAPQLGADSYLMTMDQRIKQEFIPASEAAWPVASGAFSAIAGADLPKGLDVGIFRPVIEAVVVQKLTADIKPQSCSAISDILASIEPLPAANVGKLVVAIISASGEAGKNDQFAICDEI